MGEPSSTDAAAGIGGDTPHPGADPRKTLRMIDAAAIVVGSVVGGAIFFTSGQVAAHVRTPAAFLGAWLFGGLVSLAGALSNGELGALFPRIGGEYVFLRNAYHPVVGFVSGWTSFWIAFPGSIAMLAYYFGVSVEGLLGADSPAVRIGVAIAAVVALTVANLAGLRPGKWIQNGLSGAKLVVFAALLVLGAFAQRHGAPTFTPAFGTDSPSEFSAALIPIFFAYSGWNAATYVAGEMKDAERNLGRALAFGTGICTLLYVALNAIYLKALPLPEMAKCIPVGQVSAETLLGRWVALPFTALIAVSILSSLQASILVAPRIYQAMAEDRLFFAFLAKTHPKTKAPVASLLAQGALSIALLVLGKDSAEYVLNLTTAAIVFFASLTVVAVIILRVRLPDTLRPFRVPLYPLTPLFFVAVNVWVLFRTVRENPRESGLGALLVLLGVPVAIAYQRRNARDARPLPPASTAS